MKICPKCNHEWPDEFLACPLDGTTLIEKTANPLGFNLNLGDANAISGGVNMSDNHSVSNNTVNTSTSTVDSHNVITNHITQVDRQKTDAEMLFEKKKKYRAECIKVFQDGKCDADERVWLREFRMQIDLDEKIAFGIFEEVRANAAPKSAMLGELAIKKFDAVKDSVQKNKLELIKSKLIDLEGLARRYSDQELQYMYYMLQSILSPEKCIKEYEEHKEDKYWQIFWASVAYRCCNKSVESDDLMYDIYDKWIDTIPKENAYVLGTINYILSGEKKDAIDTFKNVNGDHSPYLASITEALYYILNANSHSDDESLSQTRQKSLFYLENLFTTAYENINESKRLAEDRRRRAEEEKLRKEQEEKARLKAEAEARKKAEEEARRKAEEERKRAEEARIQAEREEQRRREEAERVRKEREEKARLKAEAEARKKAEEEARRKAEEERKRAEEVRIQAEREEQRRREEADRVRKEREEKARLKAEAEARKQAEEKAQKKAEERKRAEEERKRTEEAERLRREEEKSARIRAEIEARLIAQVKARAQAEEDARLEQERLARWPKFCRKCGNKLTPGQKFCNKCGNKIEIN